MFWAVLAGDVDRGTPIGYSANAPRDPNVEPCNPLDSWQLGAAKFWIAAVTWDRYGAHFGNGSRLLSPGYLARYWSPIAQMSE